MWLDFVRITKRIKKKLLICQIWQPNVISPTKRKQTKTPPERLNSWWAMHTTHFSGKFAHLSTQCNLQQPTKTNQNTTRTSQSSTNHAHYTFQSSKLRICQLWQLNVISTTKQKQARIHLKPLNCWWAMHHHTF